jgi:hypothetical protein
MTIARIGVGDVLTVNTHTVWAPFIDLGELMAGQAHHVDHVLIAHHQDKDGIWWGIEGRPGGVGWVTTDKYLADPHIHTRWNNSNASQARTEPQRAAIAKTAEGLLGVGYDWIGGIAADAFVSFRAGELAELIDDWWGWNQGGPRPGHVVCSSLAAWTYDRLGLASPISGRPSGAELCTPGDWWKFNNAQAAASS